MEHRIYAAQDQRQGGDQNKPAVIQEKTQHTRKIYSPIWLLSICDFTTKLPFTTTVSPGLSPALTSASPLSRRAIWIGFGSNRSPALRRKTMGLPFTS